MDTPLQEICRNLFVRVFQLECLHQKRNPHWWGFLERAMGLEPTTFSLARRHSTN